MEDINKIIILDDKSTLAVRHIVRLLPVRVHDHLNSIKKGVQIEHDEHGHAKVVGSDKTYVVTFIAPGGYIEERGELLTKSFDTREAAIKLHDEVQKLMWNI